MTPSSSDRRPKRMGHVPRDLQRTTDNPRQQDDQEMAELCIGAAKQPQAVTSECQKPSDEEDVALPSGYTQNVSPKVQDGRYYGRNDHGNIDEFES